MKKCFDLTKRIISIILVFFMVLSTFPSGMYSYGKEIEEKRIYTAGELIEHGSKFYNVTKNNDGSWTPISLTAFTLKATGISDPVMSDNDGVYKYLEGDYQRQDNNAGGIKNYSILGLIDKIYDQMAMGLPYDEIKPNVIELLERQSNKGKFSANSSEHAKAILVLDAYYGLDYDEEWEDCQPSEGKGRINAIKALINTTRKISITTEDDEGFWNVPNGRFVGAYLEPAVKSPLPGRGHGFISYTTSVYTGFLPAIALSNYAEHPELQNDVSDIISYFLAGIESSFSAYNYYPKWNDSINMIPAFISLDGVEVNPDIIQKLGGKQVTGENNKINASELINAYRYLDSLSYTFQFDNKELKAFPDKPILQEDGSFNAPATNGTLLESYSSEYLTQQAIIAASDIIEGESAYNRIKSSRAIALDKIKEDINDINIPEKIEVNLESIQAGNNTAAMDLPITGKNGSKIIWSSSDEQIISSDGLVTFPEKLSRKITLTATVKTPYENHILEKSRDFIVEVDSKMLGIAGQMLNERISYLDKEYGDDISSLGYEGIIAYSEAGRDISNMKIADLSHGSSAEDHARNIIQIVLSGNNPYDYNDKNYVDILKAQEEKYNGNPVISIALDFVGENNEALISDIASSITTYSAITTSASIVIPYSSSINSVVMLDNSGKLSNATSSTAISMTDIKNDYIKFAGEIQGQDGMFGNTVEEHSAVVSAMISLGEDLFSQKYIKGENTVLSFVDRESMDNLDVINILSNVLSKDNIWIRSNLTQEKYQKLLDEAAIIADMGVGKYSPSSLQELDAVIEKAKKAKNYGEIYFELKDAINNLSTSILPEFTDLGNYTKDSSDRFLEKAEEFYNFISSNRKYSVEDANKYAKVVIDAYNMLQSKSDNKTSAFAVNDFTDRLNYVSQRNTVLGLGLTDSQREARRILEKTMKAYDEKYGYDVSSSSYWGVFETAAMGKDLSRYKVYDVTKHKNGLLSTYQATDFAAIILQLVITGENPYDYKGINYVDWLKKEEGTDSSTGEGDGNFGPYANNIWALMALGSVGEYNEKLVKIVTGMAKKGQYTDTEAWALAALQNYRNEISLEDMSLIIENFHDKMEAAAEKNGENWSIGNAFTHGCVITGLIAAGEDLTSDKWTKNGTNMLTSLEKVFQTEDGKFIVGDYMEPDFVKDAIIGLGDAVQGSNVWQRTYLDKAKLTSAIEKAEDALANASVRVPEYKKSALEYAVSSVKEITEINGNGYKYFRLLEAINDLSDVEIVQFSGRDIYTEDSFMHFENAVQESASILLKNKIKASELNEACLNIVSAYNLLKEKEDNPDPVDPGKNNIVVTFRLLGAKKHGGDGTTQTLKQGNLQTWISATRVIVSESSKVYDVFTKVLDENGYGYIGAEDNYVRYITTPEGISLGEFDNGPLSGWMYTVNGKHPNVGLRAYTLQDGDSIVWHYTDDYTVEEGSEKWNNNTTASDDTVNITLTSTVKNGSATAKLNAEDVTAAIKQAKEKGNDTIKIIPEGIESASKIILEIFKTSLNDMSKEKLNMILDTSIGSISLSNEVLEQISKQAEGNKVEIIIENVNKENLTEEQKTLVGDSKVYDISIASENKKISSFGGKKITISLPYTLNAGEKAENVTVWYMSDDEKLEKISCTYNEKTKLATFTTDHLSYYIVGVSEKQAEWSNPFTDVKSGDWFFEAVKYAVQKGLFSGTGENIYSPNMPMTRSMLVTVLYRMEGSPEVTAANTFTDVETGQWYTDAVIWANANGIVTGYGEGKFGTNDPITREQMAAILYRYAQTKGYDVTKTTELTAYTDASSVSTWAETAVKWAVSQGMITGTTNTTLSPTGIATRAQVAAILQRYIENVK